VGALCRTAAPPHAHLRVATCPPAHLHACLLICPPGPAAHSKAGDLAKVLQIFKEMVQKVGGGGRRLCEVWVCWAGTPTSLARGDHCSVATCSAPTPPGKLLATGGQQCYALYRPMCLRHPTSTPNCRAASARSSPILPSSPPVKRRGSGSWRCRWGGRGARLGGQGQLLLAPLCLPLPSPAVSTCGCMQKASRLSCCCDIVHKPPFLPYSTLLVCHVDAAV